MKRAIVLTITGLMLLAMSAAAQGMGPMAGPGPDGCRFNRDGGRMMMGHGNRGEGGQQLGRLLQMADELNLTQEQKDSITKMQKTFGVERIDLKANLEKAELELRNLRMSKASDAEVLAAMDKVGQYRTDMQKMMYRHRQAIKNVLTNEQQAKLKEMRQQRLNKDCPMGPGMGQGRQGGRGQGQGMNRPGKI